MSEKVKALVGKPEVKVKPKTLIGKLLNIQSRLKAPKGQYNSFGKYHYRSSEDILEAVKPLLAENECILMLSDEILLIGDRYYVKTTATIMDEMNQLSVTASAREEDEKKGMDSSQLTGATSSYARKYALNGLFCIDDTKDFDTNEVGIQADNAPAEPAITPETIKAINELGINIDKLLPYYKVTDIHQMTDKQGRQAVERKKIQLQRKKEATPNESGNV